MRRALLYLGGWLAAVVIATGVGFAAISLVGDDVGAPGTAVALIAAPPPSAVPSGQATSTPRPSRTTSRDDSDRPEPGTTSSRPGTKTSRATSFTDAATVNGQCRGSTPRLTSWAPKTGWSVVDTDLVGSRRHVSFSDGSKYVTVTLRCVDGAPTFTTTTTDMSPTTEPSPTPEPTPTETNSVEPERPSVRRT